MTPHPGFGGSMSFQDKKRILQEVAAVALEPSRTSGGLWHLQVKGHHEMPPVEAEETDGFLALSLPLAPTTELAPGVLQGIVRQWLLWNGQNHGNARFCLCPGLGFCLRAEVVLSGAEAFGLRLKAAFSGLGKGWRAFQDCQTGAPSRFSEWGEEASMVGEEMKKVEWASLLGGLGISWHERADGTAVLSSGEGRVVLKDEKGVAAAEQEMADITEWPALNQNALGLLLLSLNGRLRMAHAALLMRGERLQAVLRTQLSQPLDAQEIMVALASMEAGYSLCGREVQALESVLLAEKFVEVGIQFLSNQHC